MSINFNGTSINKIIYNGTELTKVVYNGTTVWENYTRPTVFADFESVFVRNEGVIPIKYKLSADKGITFDSTEWDPNVDNEISFTLEPKAQVYKFWFWIGEFAQPSSISFTIEMYTTSGVFIERIYFYYEEETSTTTTTYSNNKKISSEGNFIYYQGGNDK